MVLNLDDAQKVDETETVPLFVLDGKTYTIPAKPKANITLKYLRNIRTMGEDIAAGELLEGLLGSEGYEALMNHDDLTMDQFQQVMLAAQKHVLGAIEEAQGNA